MVQQGTLLGVFAHPDDESYSAGGTLARYAAEGVNVYAVVATDGAAGSSIDREHQDGKHELAEIRARELEQAVAALGVTGLFKLPYRDSGMRGDPANDHPRALIQQPIESLKRDLVELMEQLLPQVIITHDAFGGYGHPDHIQVSRAATEAFHALRQPPPAKPSANLTAHPPQLLYYTTMGWRVLKLAVRLIGLLGLDPTAAGHNKDINLLEASQNEPPVTTRIDVSSYSSQKLAAIRAHASQNRIPRFAWALPVFGRMFLRNESFSRVYPPYPDGRIETDLFAGVEPI